MSPLLPILILILGAFSLLIGLRRSFRHVGTLASGVVLLALLATLPLGIGLPREATLSAWQPPALFALSLTLRADPVAWLFSLALLTLTLTILVTGLARPGGRRLAARSALLLLAAAGLTSLLAANLITLALAWAALDLIYFLALIAQARQEREVVRSVVSLGFNAAGTSLAVAAAVFAAGQGQAAAFDARLPAPAIGLLSLAVVFRLGLFPFQVALPDVKHLRQGLGIALRLVPASVALHLLARLLAAGIPERFSSWLGVAGFLAAVAGALQWWLAADGIRSDPRYGSGPRHGARPGPPYFVVAVGGLALVAGIYGGELAVPALVALSLCLILAGGVLFLFEGHEPGAFYQTAWPLAALAALAGLPFTLGFPGARGLYGGLAGAGNWGGLAVSLGASGLLVAGGLRLTFSPREAPPIPDPLARLVTLGGLTLPLLFLVYAGLFSGRLNRLAGAGTPTPGPELILTLVGVLLAGLAGVGLWALAGTLLAPAAPAAVRAIRIRARLAGLLHLDWLYVWLWAAFRLLARLLRALAGVVEGEGALLWSLVIALLVWLVFLRR